MLIRLAITLALTSNGFAGDGPFLVTDPPVFHVTETTAAGAGEQGRTEQSPPSHDPARQSPAVREYLPRLVIYTAPDWCEPCRRLDKEVTRLKSLEIGGKQLWTGKIGPGNQHAIQVIDASCDPSPEMTLAKKSRVASWPTIIRLDADGKEEWRYTGTLTAEQLSQFQAGTEHPGRPDRKVNAAIDGLHTHRCSRCSFQWAHSPATITDHVAAHRCNRCGTETYEIDHMGPVTAGAK